MTLVKTGSGRKVPVTSSDRHLSDLLARMVIVAVAWAVGLVSNFCFSLSSGQVIYFDMDSLRYLPAGFRGSVAVVAVSSSQAGGPAVGAVAVERGSWTGDISKATEGSPIATGLLDPPPGCVQ